MEHADEMATSTWVSERLAYLQARDPYVPSSHDALARFRKRQRSTHAVRVALLGAIVALVVTVPLWKPLPLAHTSAAARKLQNGQAAPDFESKDATDTVNRLSTYKGKVVALNFWATWCGGCKVEIPWLMEFQQRYESRGFVVIGVSMDDDDGWKVVKPFIASAHISYPIILGNDLLAGDYGLSAMPMTFLIDRKGRIASTRVGLMDKDAFEREIRRLIDQR